MALLLLACWPPETTEQPADAVLFQMCLVTCSFSSWTPLCRKKWRASHALQHCLFRRLLLLELLLCLAFIVPAALTGKPGLAAFRKRGGAAGGGAGRRRPGMRGYGRGSSSESSSGASDEEEEEEEKSEDDAV